MVLTYQILLTLACVAMIANAAANVLYMIRDVRRWRTRNLPPNPPRISVCIPARNEALNIAACVESLARQSYPNFEILVLDDCSDDDTAAQARAAAAKHPNISIRVIEGEPLPRGWIGKSWACHQMSRAAAGDYLLFTDADTVWSRRAVERFMILALETRADLLSGPPRLDAVTIWERLTVPMLTFAGGTVLTLPLISHPAMKDYAVASGACLLFRREAYDQIDGHRGVRAQIVEDLELARRVKRCRLRLHLTDGSLLVRCRMYRSLREVWEGFTKNYCKGFGALLTPLALIATLAIYVGPFVSFVIGPWLGWGVWAGTILPGFQVATLVALRSFFTRPPTLWAALITPFSAIFISIIGFWSWARSLLRRPTPWRARHYEMWHRDPARVTHIE